MWWAISVEDQPFYQTSTRTKMWGKDKARVSDDSNSERCNKRSEQERNPAIHSTPGHRLTRKRCQGSAMHCIRPLIKRETVWNKKKNAAILTECPKSWETRRGKTV